MLVLWGLYYPSLSRASCLSRRLNQNWSACIKETSHLVLQPGASPPFPCPLRSSWPLPPPRESLLPGSPLGSVASGGLLYLCRGWELCKRLMPQCDSVVVLVINFFFFLSLIFKVPNSRASCVLRWNYWRRGNLRDHMSPRPCQGLSVRHLPCSQCKGSLS